MIHGTLRAIPGPIESLAMRTFVLQTNLLFEFCRAIFPYKIHSPLGLTVLHTFSKISRTLTTASIIVSTISIAKHILYEAENPRERCHQLGIYIVLDLLLVATHISALVLTIPFFAPTVALAKSLPSLTKLHFLPLFVFKTVKLSILFFCKAFLLFYSSLTQNWLTMKNWQWVLGMAAIPLLIKTYLNIKKGDLFFLNPIVPYLPDYLFHAFSDWTKDCRTQALTTQDMPATIRKLWHLGELTIEECVEHQSTSSLKEIFREMSNHYEIPLSYYDKLPKLASMQLSNEHKESLYFAILSMLYHGQFYFTKALEGRRLLEKARQEEATAPEIKELLKWLVQNQTGEKKRVDLCESGLLDQEAATEIFRSAEELVQSIKRKQIRFLEAIKPHVDGQKDLANEILKHTINQW